jgi:hypothetical protein
VRGTSAFYQPISVSTPRLRTGADPAHEMQCSILKYKTINKVQKGRNNNCNTPSPEHFRAGLLQNMLKNIFTDFSQVKMLSVKTSNLSNSLQIMKHWIAVADIAGTNNGFHFCPQFLTLCLLQ